MIHEYPNALIVHTHRDPLRVVCSLASLVDLLRRLASDDVSIGRLLPSGSTTSSSVSTGRLRLDATEPCRQDRRSTSSSGTSWPIRWRWCTTIYERLGIGLTTDGGAAHATRSSPTTPRRSTAATAYSFADTGPRCRCAARADALRTRSSSTSRTRRSRRVGTAAQPSMDGLRKENGQANGNR